VLNQSVKLEKQGDPSKPKITQYKRMQKFFNESLNGMRKIFDSDAHSPLNAGASS